MRSWGAVVRRGKRQREYVTESQAREAVKKILALEEDDLIDSGKLTSLPYPGMRRSPSSIRPPVDFNFVGKDTLDGLLREWHLGYTELVVYGPKGIGKSSEFRALACLLYQKLNTVKAKQELRARVVFLWGITLLQDIVAALKDALLFSYLVDSVENVDGWQDVEAVIKAIKSTQDIISFISSRKGGSKPEIFHFLVDGGEKLDPADFLGKPVLNSEHLSAVGRHLQQVLATGERVWWCTSSGASQAIQELPFYTYGNEAFNNDEYSIYASDCILGKIPARRASIYFYTGLVPLFLDVLCDSCNSVICETKLQSSFRDRKLWERSGLAAAFLLDGDDEADASALEEEDEYWDAVIKTFCEHTELKAVSRKADRIVVQEDYLTDESMASLDPTYVLNAGKGQYCSPYIKTVYVKTVRSKEEVAKPHANGVWLAYASRKLSDTSEIDWLCLGHLCEDVLASVIPKKGLVLGQLKVCGAICVETFNSIPSRTIKSLVQLKPNSGYYYKPWERAFPDVDGVIVWVDEKGELHVVALQFTVNIDRHLHSADQFMSLASLKRWFPDIEEYVMDTASTLQPPVSPSTVKLHFAFIGCSSRPGVCSSEKKSTLKKRRRTVIGTPAYMLHVQPFDTDSIPGLSADDYKVLVDITQHRTWTGKSNYTQVCDDGFGLLALSRKELEKMAKEDFGIPDPGHNVYKNKALLINAMLST
ncbi:uncharacterized protein LOC9648904 [Selaginella moellendorffii]|nr:uncharacterized protein LOC9648904 [Selaginella moellendorffii]|eukprot:XP_024514785.1 uncharacterized protein LOC9648904 [Selaginella moellendorffii]